jgi:hypothetical protein
LTSEYLKFQACSASGYIEPKVIEIDYNDIKGLEMNEQDKKLILEFKNSNISNRKITLQSDYVNF